MANDVGATDGAKAVKLRLLSSEMRTGRAERRIIGTSRPPPPHLLHGSLREPPHLLQPDFAFLEAAKREWNRREGYENIRYNG